MKNETKKMTPETILNVGVKLNKSVATIAGDVNEVYYNNKQNLANLDLSMNRRNYFPFDYSEAGAQSDLGIDFQAPIQVDFRYVIGNMDWKCREIFEPLFEKVEYVSEYEGEDGKMEKDTETCIYAWVNIFTIDFNDCFAPKSGDSLEKLVNSPLWKYVPAVIQNKMIKGSKLLRREEDALTALYSHLWTEMRAWWKHIVYPVLPILTKCDNTRMTSRNTGHDFKSIGLFQIAEKLKANSEDKMFECTTDLFTQKHGKNTIESFISEFGGRYSKMEQYFIAKRTLEIARTIDKNIWWDNNDDTYTKGTYKFPYKNGKKCSILEGVKELLSGYSDLAANIEELLIEDNFSRGGDIQEAIDKTAKKAVQPILVDLFQVLVGQACVGFEKGGLHKALNLTDEDRKLAPMVEDRLKLDTKTSRY